MTLTHGHIATPAGAAAQPVASQIEAVQADLGLRLLVALAKEKGKESSVQASPASVAAVFSYLYLGASPIMKGAIGKMLGLRPEETDAAITSFRQSAKTLIDVSAEKGPLAFAYAMFALHPGVLVPGASELLAREGMSTFVAKLETAEGIAIVNKWVADHTGNLISKLLDPKGLPGAVMTAINALYFKDKWERQFNATQTKRAPFHLFGGKTADVDMMSQDIKLATRENGRFVAAKLPYVTPGFSLVIVTTRDEPAPMVAFAGVADLLIGADFQARDVNLSIPRFKLETNVNLLPILRAFALSEGLDPPAPTPFPRLIAATLTGVFQGCVIKVNEEGTEGSAATAVIFSKGPMPPRILVNNPFVYALRDEQRGMILLTGYVANPSAQ